ncbi:MAG: hypothetical protein ABSH27_00280 [Solirubrobacteraceae bacterium]
MSRITRPLLCLLVACSAVGFAFVVAPLGSSAASVRVAKVALHPVVGIGDDKSDMFSDPRFRALGIRAVRYDMSWDALSVTYQRQEVTRSIIPTA